MRVLRRSRRLWLLAAVVLALLLGGAAYGISRHVVQKQLNHFAERLLLLSSLRKQALENYFDTARAEIIFWSLSDDLRERHAALLADWNREQQEGVADRIRQAYVRDNPWPPSERNRLEDAADGSRYSAIHAKFHPLARLFVTQRGYYDFFLIDPDGEIFYSVQKEADFGTNLETGAWRDTGLADVFRRSILPGNRGRVVFSDLEPYGPSNDEPAMFMATAIRSDNGGLLGVLALQLPTDRINAIMAFTEGMGDTGETYLVGQDYLMRSNSRFSEESTILRTRVDTIPARRALAGENATVFARDYRGVEVLSAYDSIELDGFRWAVLAEMDREEVLRTLSGRRPAIAGIAFLFFVLVLWTFWYIRPDDLSIDLLGGTMPPEAGEHPDVGE